MYYNCPESLHTRMADYLCILPQLRHYFIRPQNISFPQRKMCMHTAPLCQCCHWTPLSPVLAKSFSLTSEGHSDKKQNSSSPTKKPQLSVPNFPDRAVTAILSKTIQPIVLPLLKDQTRLFQKLCIEFVKAKAICFSM